jgi:CelD/BcsL family acetyltransferase involved in cellulose biosynthesis
MIDACSVADLARLEPLWDDLAARALEPNPFAESTFVIPAARCIPQRKLIALCVWDSPERTRLNALVALQRPIVPFGVADVWRSEQAPLAALLVDRETAGPALESMTDWLARNWPGTVGLGLANVDVDGALAQAFRDLSVRRSLRLEASNPRRRAALACGGGASFETLIAARRRKEWARLKRRLMDCGRLDFDWSGGPAAIEDFLRLEAAGWKGAQATALAADRKRASFARETLGGFAARGRLRVARLSLDGRPIAAGAVLRAGARAFYWKTGYDPAYAPYSPGLQLTLAMSRELEADRGLRLADSCADPNHPMIDRIWTQRIEVMDFVLQTRPDAALAFRLAIESRRARALARRRVKELVSGWRRRPANPRASAPPPAT